MKAIVLADTGPLYALVDPSDQYHRRARREALLLKRNAVDVALPYPILLESYTLILHRLGIKIGHRWLREVKGGTGFLNPTQDDYEDASRLTKLFPDQPITLFDAVLAVLGKRLGLPIWTFDHHIEVIRGSIWRPPGH